MSDEPVRLWTLIHERHWQKYETFQREYDRAARGVDPVLVGSCPSRAQLYRWMGGQVKRLPYPDACRVLEGMFPGHTIRELMSPVSKPALTMPAATPTPDLSDVPRNLRAIARIRRFTADELEFYAARTGSIVDLNLDVEIEIDREGWATLHYRHDLLNLTDRPVTRLVRELWFENTRGGLTLDPSPACQRAIQIQRIHDTDRSSQFACQIDPPILPGECATVGYVCQGGQFVSDHYWRQSFTWDTRYFTLTLRQHGIEGLNTCTATEEFIDGGEKSATDDLITEVDDGDALITLTRDHIGPNQAVTLRWEAPRAAA